MMKFSEIPVNMPFWDPFVQRAFIKISPVEAKCMTFPVDWTTPSNEFDQDEEVEILGSLNKYLRDNMNRKCSNILRNNNFKAKAKRLLLKAKT